MAAPMSEEFLDAIQFSKSKLRVTDLNLKDKQLEALYACYEGHDCVAVLPTGYGKSLIFQILPWLLQKKYEKSEAMIVIVVSPLNSIMQDQVVGLVEKGIKACYLNNTGSAAKTYEIAQGEEDGDPDDEFKELETPVYTEKSVSLASLKNGDYKLIYAHPETLMSNSVIGRMLRSKIYKEQVGCIAIDEVHLVADWGQQFRKDFQKLSELNALFTDAVHIVVTATLTPLSMNILIKDLQLSNPTVIKTNPDRINIYIEKKTRLPNVRKFDKFDDLIEPLFLELKAAKSEFPVTIVYVDGLDCLCYCYQYLDTNMGSDGYLPASEPVPETRIFAQYHKSYTNRMKELIVKELRKTNPVLRLVLATVALGMGLDAPSVARVIHFRPPTSLESYMQEIGRAGRNGQQAKAILYFNKSDIASNRPGITLEMRDYCDNNDTCLRKQMLAHFGVDKPLYNGQPDLCCSNCTLSLTSCLSK